MITVGWKWLLFILSLKLVITTEICEAFALTHIQGHKYTSTTLSKSKKLDIISQKRIIFNEPFRSYHNSIVSLKMLDDMNENPNEINEGPYEALASRPGLALLDLTSLLIFAAIGKASHTADGSIDFTSVLVTALPFIVSWFSVSPLLGSYDRLATQDTGGAFLYTARGWCLAIPLGCVLRGIIKGYVPPTPFVIVTMISTLVILGGSRALYTVAKEKTSSIP